MRIQPNVSSVSADGARRLVSAAHSALLPSQGTAAAVRSGRNALAPDEREGLEKNIVRMLAEVTSGMEP